jgi:glyoxylase-like metal-dependent hydrolase (beta-lactamase superfamily II)
MIDFRTIGDRVYVARTSPLDVNVTLVVGDEAALVIDTLSTDAQAEGLLAAIRALTPLPLTVLNTHHHFDHCVGNAVIAAGDRPIWAHPSAATAMLETAQFKIQIPNHLVRATEHLDLGDRIVTITHHGRAHTDGDLVAVVTDADVMIVGDLIEEGAPPSFGDDSYPLDWPEALAATLRGASPSTAIVPGHGAVVDVDFGMRQHAQLAAFAWLIRDGHADGARVEEIAAQAPWPAEASRPGVERGFALLDDPI